MVELILHLLIRNFCFTHCFLPRNDGLQRKQCVKQKLPSQAILKKIYSVSGSPIVLLNWYI